MTKNKFAIIAIKSKYDEIFRSGHLNNRKVCYPLVEVLNTLYCKSLLSEVLNAGSWNIFVRQKHLMQIQENTFPAGDHPVDMQILHAMNLESKMDTRSESGFQSIRFQTTPR